MSSDEKALKPSERIEEILFEKYPATGILAIPNAIIDYLDEQAELLDTHTVKEEQCDCNGMHEGNCPDPRVELTTPEKKCCENHFLGIGSCHQEKLPTSSYEVTCGRCEKSIKHSCGAVKI